MPHPQATVGLPRIAAAVAARAGLVEIVDPIDLRQVVRRFEARKEIVAFLVDIWCRDVSNLAGRAAQADPLVLDGRANPDGPPVVAELVGTPETHVMTMPGTVSHRGCSKARSSLRPNR